MACVRNSWGSAWRGGALALTLFVLGIGADHHHRTLAADDLAALTARFDGRSNLHASWDPSPDSPVPARLVHQAHEPPRTALILHLLPGRGGRPRAARHGRTPP